jgi:hypothetical protein
MVCGLPFKKGETHQPRLELINATTLASIATTRITHMDYLCIPGGYSWQLTSENTPYTHSGE